MYQVHSMATNGVPSMEQSEAISNAMTFVEQLSEKWLPTEGEVFANPICGFVHRIEAELVQAMPYFSKSALNEWVEAFAQVELAGCMKKVLTPQRLCSPNEVLGMCTILQEKGVLNEIYKQIIEQIDIQIPRYFDLVRELDLLQWLLNGYENASFIPGVRLTHLLSESVDIRTQMAEGTYNRLTRTINIPNERPDIRQSLESLVLNGTLSQAENYIFHEVGHSHCEDERSKQYLSNHWEAYSAQKTTWFRSVVVGTVSAVMVPFLSIGAGINGYAAALGGIGAFCWALYSLKKWALTENQFKFRSLSLATSPKLEELAIRIAVDASPTYNEYNLFRPFTYGTEVNHWGYGHLNQVSSKKQNVADDIQREENKVVIRTHDRAGAQLEWTMTNRVLKDVIQNQAAQVLIGEQLYALWLLNEVKKEAGVGPAISIKEYLSQAGGHEYESDWSVAVLDKQLSQELASLGFDANAPTQLIVGTLANIMYLKKSARQRQVTELTYEIMKESLNYHR